MSDIREPNDLGIARLEEKLAELEFSLKRTKRRKVEVTWEMKKLDENESMTLKAIEEIKTQISNIPEE